MYYLGIDVGGTSLKAGLVVEDGKMIDTANRPVEIRQTDFDGYLAGELAALTRTLLDNNKLTSRDIPYVGAGLPGSVDDRSGVFLFAPNMPISNSPLRELFGKHLDIPLRLGNDANCAALGEYIAGAGKQYSSLALITLGTGVGTGVILNGKIWTGCNGAATEGGHIVIRPDGWRCGCGRRGCLETYASASGLIRMAINQMLSDRGSKLWDTADGSLDKVTGITVFKAATLEDPAALRALDEYTDALAQGIVNIINLLQPEVIALGGGIANAPDALLLEPLRKKIVGRDMAKYNSPKTKLLRAVLGNEAGIIGAAMMNR